jgi:D-alanine-D-alanine ligase
VVRQAAELPAAMVDCLAYGHAVLAERFVAGTEVAVSVVADPEPRALPVVEIQAKGGIYDYTARYTPGATAFPCPAGLPEEVLGSAEATALAVHRLLGLRDLSRTDAIVTEDGTVHVLEVNVTPGLTETSLLPTAAEAAGERLGSLFSVLIDNAVRRG